MRKCVFAVRKAGGVGVLREKYGKIALFKLNKLRAFARHKRNVAVFVIFFCDGAVADGRPTDFFTAVKHKLNVNEFFVGFKLYFVGVFCFIL